MGQSAVAVSYSFFYQKKRKKEKKDNTFVLHIDFFS